MTSKKSKGSHESRSSRASRETKSFKSSGDKEIQEKMEVAELIAEAELLQQKQIIQNEAEKLKKKERLAKAKARIQAYNNIELEGGKEKEQLQPKLLEENWIRSIRMDDASRVAKIEIEPDRGAVITRREQNAQYRNTWDLQHNIDGKNLLHKTTNEELEYGRDQKNITDMMCELLKQQPGPELEINIFDGNPMDFHYFMVVFKEVVENKVTDPRGWLTHLIKFTKGEAKEIA